MIERGVGAVRFTNASSPLFQSAVNDPEMRLVDSESAAFS
jgi:hypothetical protein